MLLRISLNMRTVQATKKIVKLTKPSELNSFSNMVAQIDIGALKLYNQTKTNRLKIGKKIKNNQPQLKT